MVYIGQYTIVHVFMKTGSDTGSPLAVLKERPPPQIIIIWLSVCVSLWKLEFAGPVTVVLVNYVL